MRLVSSIYPDYYPFQEGMSDVFDSFINSSNEADLQEGDVLLVWGGEDISPALYDEPVNVFGDGSITPSRRDQIEWGMMLRAKALGIPIIGICRGAQMLCALAGGSLWQHVDNHAGARHYVETYDGQKLLTNSVHHQMMRLDGIPRSDYQLIGWTDPRSEHYHYGARAIHSVTPDQVDPEFVWFNRINGFAIQWHPEFVDYPDEATDYVFNFIRARIGVTV